MPSNIFTKNQNKRPVEYITLSGVDKKQAGDLSDYLRRKLNEDETLTLRKIEERSGGKITHSYLSKILNRVVKNPSVEKLQAIAKGLGVSDDEVLAAVRGKRPEDDPDFLKSRLGLLSLKFNKIPIDKRVNVEALIDLLDREVERLTKK
ncbi:MAG: hypothetical protein QOG71_3603 [Pyrinomonadaceae bacterium]|nr:hypothetical protein [Pyrinomonadaceae bacterium]